MAAEPRDALGGRFGEGRFEEVNVVRPVAHVAVNELGLIDGDAAADLADFAVRASALSGIMLV